MLPTCLYSSENILVAKARLETFKSIKNYDAIKCFKILKLQAKFNIIKEMVYDI